MLNILNYNKIDLRGVFRGTLHTRYEHSSFKNRTGGESFHRLKNVAQIQKYLI
jgi:hypothetical protein